MTVYDKDKKPNDSHEYPLVSDDPRLTSKKLGEAEGNAGSQAATGAEKSEANKIGKGFNTADKFLPPSARALSAVSGLFTKKRARNGGIVGGIVAMTIFVSTVGQGPMQLVHFSQLMQKFHLSARDDESNSRVTKIGKYMYHVKRGDGVEKVRLGTLGNKYADRVERKMNKSGIETLYTEKSGYRVGYAIDPENLKGTDLEKYQAYDKKGKLDKAKTNKNVSAAIERELGVKPKLDSGVLVIDSQDNKLTNIQARQLQRKLLRISGYSKSVSAVNERVMGKRAGLTWHPIQKVDKKLQLKSEDLYKKWKEDRKKQAQKGDSVSARSSDTDKDGNKTPDGSDAEQSAQEVQQGAQEAGSSDGPERSSKIDALRESKGFKAGAGAAAAVGVACLIKDVADSSEEIKDSQIIKPAMRIAGDYVAAGSQVQSGHDLDMTQVGFYVKQMNGVDASGEKSSWNNAATTRAELGKSGGVVPLATLTTIGGGTPFDFIKEGSVGTAVGAACSTAGTIVTSIIGVATGPISFAAGTVLGAVLGPVVMNQLVDWISGNALNPLPVGADLGNTVNYGSRLMARSQGVATGGRELSATESAQREQLIDEDSQAEFAQRNLKDRLFDTKDYRSFASRTIDSGQLSPKGLASTISSPFGSLGKFGSQISGITTAKAKASSAYDYGFPDVGFSQDELDNPKVDNPFKNAEYVIKTILPSHPDYIDRANKCFGVTVDPSSYDVTSLQAGDPSFKTPDDSDCKDKSEDFMQFRMYILDTQTMMSLSCLEADDTKPDDAEGTQACADIGFGGQGSAGLTDSSVDRDAQSLAQQLLDNSNVTYPYTDTHGVTVRQVLEGVAKDGKGLVNGDNAANKGSSVAVSGNLLKALAEYAKDHKIGLNALTNATHSSGSNHYKGIAIDIACSPNLDRAAFDAIAKNYGGANNGEVCPGNSHWHYDFKD